MTSRQTICVNSYIAIAAIAIMLAPGCSEHNAASGASLAPQILSGDNSQSMPPPAFYVPIIDQAEMAVIDPATNEVEAIDNLFRGRAPQILGPHLIVADPTHPRIFLVASVGNAPQLLVYSTIAHRVNSAVDLPAGTPTTIGDLALGPNGSRLFIPGSDSVIVMSTLTKTVIKTLSFDSQPEGLTVAADGHKLFVALPDKNEIAIADTASLAVHVIRAGGCHLSKQCRPHEARAFPDQSMVLFSGGREGSGFVMDAVSEQVVAQVPAEMNDIIALDPSTGTGWVGFSTCCNLFVSQISLTPPFSLLQNFQIHTRASIAGGAFSPSGQGLAVFITSLIPSPFSNDQRRFIHLGLPMDNIVYAP